MILYSLDDASLIASQSFSGVKIGRGSPVCKNCFENGIPQHKLVKTFNISPSILQNNRLRESEEVSVHKGQSIFNDYDQLKTR